jgi:hypothetical protein
MVSGFIAEEKYFPDIDTYLAIMTNAKSGDDAIDLTTGSS